MFSHIDTTTVDKQFIMGSRELQHYTAARRLQRKVIRNINQKPH